MDTVDANIPLQAQGPAPITLNSIAQMMQMKQQIQQQRQASAVQNSLAAIYSNPANLGPDGMPKPDAIQKISQISPQAGMQLRTQQAKLDADQALGGQRKAEMYKTKAEAIHDAIDPSITAYDQARANGLPEDQARLAGQRAYTDNMTSLKQSGLFSNEEIAQMPSSFDPDRVRAGAIKYKDFLGLQEKQKADDRDDRRMADTEKHQAQMIGLEGARLGLESERLGREQGADATAASLSPGALKAAAARYNVDGTLPPMGMGKAGAGARDAILNMAADMAAGKDPTEQRVDQLASKASASARAGLERTINNVQLAEKTALGSASQVEDISKNYQRTGSPLVNETINAYRSRVEGDPQLAKLSTAVNTLKNEYTKVMAGTGTSTDAARSEADHLININMSHDQLMASIGQMKAEMEQARESAIQKSRDLSTDATKNSGKAGKKLVYDPATGTFK